MMFESCICIDFDGGDECQPLKYQTPKARKQHKCIECSCIIQPGENYKKDTMIYEGEISVYKTCLKCAHIRSELLTCGWCYGGLWEAIHEAYCGDEDGECICPI